MQILQLILSAPLQPSGTDFVTLEENHALTQSTQSSLLAYDSVMALGIAGCRTETDFFSGREHFSEFLAVDFQGASGHVLIDESTGSRSQNTTSYSLSNALVTESDGKGMVSVTVVSVAEYHGRGKNQTGRWRTLEDAAFNYSDMTLNPPRPLPDQSTNLDDCCIPQLAILTSIAGAIMLSSLIFACWTWYNRTSYVVRASQPEFLILICFGVFLMALAVVTLGAESPPYSWEFTDATCMLNYWFFSMGFGVAFSALFAKTWRINKVSKRLLRIRESRYSRTRNVDLHPVAAPFQRP